MRVGRTDVAAFSLGLIGALALAAPGKAQDASGQAEKVAQSAAASGAAGSRTLQVEGPIFMGDQVRTNAAGEAQIRFIDNTRFVVGPNASVLIDEFVFNAGGASARAATFSAVKGAFRFISGNSNKDAYLIRTPVMTIGVRGTGLDGFVESGTGRTTVALYEGAAELCDAFNECIIVDDPCTIVVVPPQGGFEDPTPGTRALFLPYSLSQTRLLPDFRLDVSACRGAPAPFGIPVESSRQKRGDQGERPEPPSTETNDVDTGNGNGNFN